MPDWKFHIGVADMVAKEVGIKNISEFRLGCLLPDAPWMSVEESVNLGIRDYSHVSRRIGGNFVLISDYLTWLQDHIWSVAHYELYKGYLCHLLLDYRINEMWILACQRDGMDRIEIMTRKNHGFYTVKKSAGVKWEETAYYAYQRFSYLNNAETPIIWSSVSEDTWDLVTSDFTVDSDDIPEMKQRITQVIVAEHDEPDIRTFSNEDYEAAINRAIGDCIHLFKLIDTNFK